MNKLSTRGFTLIEIMIAVAIVAILAAVAVPSYNRYVLRTGRTEAFSAMAAVQQAQERWRANNPEYTANLSDLGINASTSPNGYYTLAITPGSASGTGYILTATAGGRQANDTGCTNLSLTVSNGDAASSPASCWSN